MGENTNQFDDETKTDKQSLDAYIENIYSDINPFPYDVPVKKEINFWRFSGVKAKIFVLQAVGAAILSAVRTGGLFLIIEMLLIKTFNIDWLIGNIFSYTAMIASLFAFEGFLLAKGISEGEELKQLNESTFALVISFIVTIGAGIFSGLGIAKVDDNINYWVNLFLALASGAGAAGMTYFGSQNIGYQIKKFNDEKEKLKNEFDNKKLEYNILLATWRSKAADTYHGSRYNVRRKDSIYNQPEILGRNQQKIHENYQTMSEQKVHYESKSYSAKMAEIITIIKQIIDETNNIPTVTQIVNKLGEQKVQNGEIDSSELNKFIADKKGYVSTVFKKFVNDHIDLKTKQFIKKFTKERGILPTAQNLINDLNIDNTEANFYLAEFITDNKNELLKKKIVSGENLQKAQLIINGNNEERVEKDDDWNN